MQRISSRVWPSPEIVAATPDDKGDLLAKRRELKPWYHQVTTALAVVTPLCVIGYFMQTLRTFFLTDHDPCWSPSSGTRPSSKRNERVSDGAVKNSAPGSGLDRCAGPDAALS